MRILYFAEIRFPLERANGIQTMETCHALARRGHFVTLVVRPDTQRPSRDPFAYYGLPLIARLRIEYAPVSGPPLVRRMGYLAFASGRTIGAGRTDVVLTRDLGVASALLRLPASLRRPVVYESHGYAPDVASALPDLIATAGPPDARKLARLARREAHVWRTAEGYVAITAALAGDLKQRFGERARVAVVPDGTRVGPEPAPSVSGGTRGAPGRRPVVVYAGHLYAWKGVDVLLEAISQLEGVEALIVGGHEQEPDLGRLRTLTTRLGIADRVRFTGLVPPPAVAAYLREADVLALPNPASAISTRYTSPLKLFEYMAAGRPIVASDLPAIREVLTDNLTAVLVPPGDAAALASAIRRLTTEAGLAERLAGAATLAVTEYSWDRRAERLEKLLAEVATSRG